MEPDGAAYHLPRDRHRPTATDERKFIMFSIARAALAACIVVPMLGVAAQAQHEHGGWHGDIHTFHDHDFGRWRGGQWFHGPHGGRDGWWWIVGPDWYFYPAPIYPYPDPYIPPVAVAQPAPAAPGPLWYFCANPQGYYPYVPQCAVPWQPVPATPPH